MRMKEPGLVAQLLCRVLEAGRAAGAFRVSAVRLRVGECSGVEPCRLASVFEVLARGTLAQGAALTIERVALESRCDDCQGRFQVVLFCFACPYCGSARTRVVAGEECVLESVTLVTEGDPSLTRIH